jgi:hypothetical protein
MISRFGSVLRVAALTCSALLPAILGSGVSSAQTPAMPASAPAPLPASAPAPATAPPGVWQKHEYSFQFMGFTTTYSCDGLAGKLKLLLIAAGARKDVKSYPYGCSSSYGEPDKFAGARLTFYTLVPRDADPTNETPPVPGTWRPVTFAPFSPQDLRTGDCELIEQFHVHLLPMFAVQNVDSNTTCIPHQLSGSTINLKFESFVAVPEKPKASNGH